MVIKFYLFLILSGLAAKIGTAVIFKLHNRCPYTVWPGTIAMDLNSPMLGDGGFILPSGAVVDLKVPSRWAGQIWARTHCVFDEAGNGRCATGDCAGGLRCAGNYRLSPVTVAHFEIGDGGDYNDVYYVSLIDGYNVGIGVRPCGGSSKGCQSTGCAADLNSNCPLQLRMTAQVPVTGELPAEEVVACMSPCTAFGTVEDCCMGYNGRPETCLPTAYSDFFRNSCPEALIRGYDQNLGMFACSDSNYLITFCPDASFS